MTPPTPGHIVTERAIFHPSDGGFDEGRAPARAPTDGAGVDIAGAQFDSRDVEINKTGIEFDERGIELQQPEDASQTERLKTRRGRGGLRTIDTIVEMPSPSPTPSLAEDGQDDAEDEITVGVGSGSDCDNADDADDVVTEIPEIPIPEIPIPEIPIGLGVRPLNEFDGPGGFTEIRYSSANPPSSASRRLQAIKKLRVSAHGAPRRVDLDKLTKPVRRPRPLEVPLRGPPDVCAPRRKLCRRSLLPIPGPAEARRDST